jgi:hypothetical protein
MLTTATNSHVAPLTPPATSFLDHVAVTFEPHFVVLLFLAFVGALIYYHYRLKRFESTYTSLLGHLPRDVSRAIDPSGSSSPGHVFALASRGPRDAFDAELKSAEVRWRHIMAAFPQLDMLEQFDRRRILLIPALYTKIDAVHEMQSFIAHQIRYKFGDQVVVPEWVDKLAEDFDVPKFPELAIANSTIYTLPFFLTWQRRHLWGVLPYAIHTRLGVLISTDHPALGKLEEYERGYQERLARDSAYGLWVHDPSLAGWLSILMKEAGENPCRLNRADSNFDEQHTRPTVFAVGVYLHQELLPLACAVLGDSETAAAFAVNAVRLEPTEFEKWILPKVQQSGPSEKPVEQTPTVAVSGSSSSDGKSSQWPNPSAVIVDLALCKEPEPSSGWRLLRMPHCVYLPIGIGYSVLSWPLLARNTEARKWTARLLTFSADMLCRSKDELSAIGIELDQRLWQHLEEEE